MCGASKDRHANLGFGEIGFDAPVQIGIIVASLLIGNGNFEKTSITSCHLYKIDEALTRKNIHTYISKENANELRLFNLSALFADLLRDRNTYSRQQLVELLEKFRDCKYFCDENLYYELDPQSVQFDLKLIELIEDVCSEARIRKWIQDWDID